MANQQQTPNKFTFNGEDYKRVKFDNYTFRQNAAARSIMAKIVEVIGDFSPEQFENANPKALAKIYELNLENELLALIYINAAESVFNEKTFEERKEAFKDMPIKQMRKYEEAYKDFFTGLSGNMEGGILTYMNQAET